MTDSTAVLSWVAIRRGCSISYRVNDDDEADFLCGESCEVTFEADTLREFLRLGADALQEMEAGRQAELSPPGPA
jgi:hypothetical protein